VRESPGRLTVEDGPVARIVIVGNRYSFAYALLVRSAEPSAIEDKVDRIVFYDSIRRPNRHESRRRIIPAALHRFLWPGLGSLALVR
jgi:hypothetical protein